MNIQEMKTRGFIECALESNLENAIKQASTNGEFDDYTIELATEEYNKIIKAGCFR